MERFNFVMTAGSAPVLRFRLKRTEDVTDWLTTLYVTEPGGNNVLTAAGSISTEVADAASLGVFDVSLSANQTTALLARKPYRYSFWRTNLGFEDPLVAGILEVRRGV